MRERIGDICTLKSGTTLKEDMLIEDGPIPYVKVSDMNLVGNEKYIVTTNSYVDNNISEKMLFPKGTVLFPKRGGAIGTNKKRIASKSVCADLNTMGVIPSERIRPLFLYYYFKNIDFGTLYNGSSVPQINNTDIAPMEINLPSLDEQDKALAQLEKVDFLIQKRTEQLAKLDELIKARFVELFGDLKETCNVGDYINALIAGKSLAGEAECENKVLKTGAASFDFFDATQVKNLPLDYEPQEDHLVNKGDIIISRMNTAELTGAAAYVWDVAPRVYLPDRLWKAVLQEGCNPIFVWQMLIQPSTKEQIRRECSGTSGSMKNISKPGMLAIKVKKVPVELQDEFADFVKQVDKSKVVVLQSLQETQILFDSLMQKYFG